MLLAEKIHEEIKKIADVSTQLRQNAEQLHPEDFDKLKRVEVLIAENTGNLQSLYQLQNMRAVLEQNLIKGQENLAETKLNETTNLAVDLLDKSREVNKILDEGNIETNHDLSKWPLFEKFPLLLPEIDDEEEEEYLESLEEAETVTGEFIVPLATVLDLIISLKDTQVLSDEFGVNIAKWFALLAAAAYPEDEEGEFKHIIGAEISVDKPLIKQTGENLKLTVTAYGPENLLETDLVFGKHQDVLKVETTFGNENDVGIGHRLETSSTLTKMAIVYILLESLERTIGAGSIFLPTDLDFEESDE